MSILDQCDVLIVEDDMSLCDIMAASLVRRGLVVRSALTASAAVAILEKVSPRVVILDYHLPGTNGVALASWIHGGLPKVPIILMSGAAENLDAETLRTSGIKVFVNKPVPMEALHRAVVRLLA